MRCVPVRPGPRPLGAHTSIRCQKLKKITSDKTTSCQREIRAKTGRRKQVMGQSLGAGSMGEFLSQDLGDEREQARKIRSKGIPEGTASAKALRGVADWTQSLDPPLKTLN